MDIKSLMACIDILNGNHEIFSDGEVLGRCYRKYPGAGAAEIDRICGRPETILDGVKWADLSELRWYPFFLCGGGIGLPFCP